MIEQATELKVSNTESNIRVSGSLENHYSPVAQVLLDKVAKAGEGMIAFSDIPTPPGVIRLASPVNIEEYSRALYQALRSADKQQISTVVVVQPQGPGLALAIRDRLMRASKGR